MKTRVFFAFLFSLICFSLVPEAHDILGIWENGGRFIEFTKDEKQNLNMKIVLKPYYTYVYESSRSFPATISPVNNFTGLNILKIDYPKVKRSVYMPICLIEKHLFTSFFQRNDFTNSQPALPDEYRPYGITADQEKEAMNKPKSPLYGFWTEQGTQDGIKLHANEVPEHFDAYFFTETEYFKFRYWKDDLANTEKQVSFKDSNKISFSVPRVFTRGTLNYACVTSNSSVLRNYEQGTYNLKYSDNSYNLTLTPVKAGPGKLAAKDTYENPQYPEIINLPLYLTEDGKIFSYGEPFLFKTEITNLEEEIKKHNSLKKEPLEPQIVPDEIDFFEERVKELEKLVPQKPGAF